MKCEDDRILSASTARLRGWKDVFLFAALGLVVLRLIIWKFFPYAEIFVREELSNLIVAGLSFLLFIGYQFYKFFAKEVWARSGFFLPAFLLFVAVGSSVFYSVDRSVSVISGVVFVAALFFFFMLCDLLDSMRRIRIFFIGMLLCALVTAAFAAREFVLLFMRQPLPSDVLLKDFNASLHYVLTRRRATSFLGWPNSLAGYLLLFLPLGGVYAVAAKGLCRRIFWGGAAVILLAGFLATFSFLGWSSFLLSACLLSPLVLQKSRRPFTIAQTAGLVFSGLFLLGAYAWVISRKDFGAALQPRLLYYQNAVALIAEHPFRGCGFGAFGMASRYLVTSQEALTAFVHNTYLQWLVETGVLGLLGILTLVAAFIFASRRALARYPSGVEGWLVIGLVWGLAAFLIDNFFSFTFIKPNIAWHGWAMLAALAATGRPVSGRVCSPALQRWFCIVPGIFAGLMLCLSICLSASFFLYMEGRVARAEGDLARAGRCFVQASRLNPWSCVYPAATGIVLANSWKESGRADFLAGSAASFEEAVRRSPLNYINYLSLGQIYAVMGQRDKSLNSFREARRLSPFEFERELRIPLTNPQAVR